MQLDRLRRITLVALALSGALAALAGAEPVSAWASTSDAGFVWPAAGSNVYAIKGSVTVTWAPVSKPASWRVARSVAPLDWTGGCAVASGFIRDATTVVHRASATFKGQLADRCYRYAVWRLPAKGSAPATYRSGTVRTLHLWDGSIDTYRSGVFSTQRKMTWCVGASIQMMLNIVRGTSDQTKANQEAYFDYARHNDAYTPADGANGTDPQGWSEALVHYGAGAYADVKSDHFRGAIRDAARRLRLTGKPVGLVVAHSNHAWVMTGFTATSDPGFDRRATITSVYVLGPLYPRKSHSGYDPSPNTRIGYDHLKRYLTRYYDSLGPKNEWEGSFVTIVP
jgi:hypothetical protein